MLPSTDSTASSERSRQLKRYGPFAVIVVLILVAVIVAVSSGGGKKDTATTTTVAAGGATAPTGAVSFSTAKKRGLKVSFNASCDQKTGRVMLPYYFSPECYANVADNGGATSPGVTADTINLVIYVAQEHDAVIDYITAAIKNDDTNAQIKATAQGYVDMYNRLYQFYGRKLKVQFLDASGGAQDEVAARADAVKAATQLHAFAVLGGPALTSAFGDELAARKVICVGCTAGAPGFYAKRAPYLYSVTMNTEQVTRHVVEYIEKKLAKRNATFAGSAAIKASPRKFGYLWIESNDDSKSQAELFKSTLAKGGVGLAASVPYTLDPARLQEQATSAITKLKSAGVTTIVFSGDPVAPSTFTKEATAQDYFPEWLLGPQVLVDTTAFARTYDQKQWAHAFGPSPLAVRIDPNKADAFRIYRWFTGVAPPAADTAPVIMPNISLFANGLQTAGPDLTPATFRAGLFSGTPAADPISQPSISFGRHGLWPYDDYNGVDDTTEIWWNPNATGLDEIRKQGQGMWEYVDGGKRYLIGKWTTADSKVFDPSGAVTILDKVPAKETPPDYPSPG